MSSQLYSGASSVLMMDSAARRQHFGLSCVVQGLASGKDSDVDSVRACAGQDVHLRGEVTADGVRQAQADERGGG